MRRHRGSGKFYRRLMSEEETIDPMEGVANLVDVMLVFACGLMLALITYWNVDVATAASDPVPVEQGEEVEDLSGLSEESDSSVGKDDLEEYGKVYLDPETGKLYMMMEGQ